MFRHAAVILFLATSLSAQSYDRVLLPIQPSFIHGAFDTVWQTVLAEHSDADQSVALRCSTAACVSLDAKGSTLVEANGSGSPAFVYVPAEQTSNIFFALRTIATRADGTHITMEIPTARESDFTSGVFHIQAVPLDDDARLSLRIYDYDGVDGTPVRVRIYTTSSTPDVDTVVTLHRATAANVDANPGAPAFATINDLVHAYPTITALQFGLATIDIEPMATGARIWAFVTSTNNVTQQFNHFSE